MKSLFYVIIIVTCILTACHPQSTIDNTLLHAESIMEDYPDSAITILDTISRYGLTQENNKALYALLLTQARHKNYIDEINDSLINMAVEYYENNNDDLHLMKAYYYQSNIQYNQQNYHKAIIGATLSNEIAKKINDNYWIAKSAEQMADIFYATYNPVEAIPHRKEAILFYKKSNKELNYQYSIFDLAVDYSNNFDNIKAKSIIDSISKYITDSLLQAKCIAFTIHNSMDMKNYDSIDNKIELLKNYKNVYDLTSIDYAYLSNYKLYQCDYNEAKNLLDTALIKAASPNDKIFAYIEYIKYLKLNDNYKESLLLTDRLLNYQNKSIEKNMRQSVISEQRNHYNQQAIKSSIHEEKMRLIMIFLIIFSLLFITSLFIFIKFKLKLKDNEIEQKISYINNLIARIDNNNVEKDIILSKLSMQCSHSEELQNLITSLLKEHFTTLNMLCDEYYEKGNSEKTRILIINQIDKEIRNISSNKNIHKIEELVNKCMNNIITKIRQQIPSIDDDDIIFLTLIYAGFSPRAICLFTNIKIKTVYTKKYRIKEKIISSNAQDKDLFILNLQ